MLQSVIKLIKMLSIHDYRNGRYQGQLKNNLPHGIGIFMHTSLTFVIAEWSEGQLDGKAIAIYPDGSTFCGNIDRGCTQGPGFYELSTDHIQILQVSGSKQQYKSAILLPLQSKIIELGRENLEIEKQYRIKDNDQPLQLEDVAQIIGLSQEDKKFYRQYSNCYTFFENYFCQTYPDIFEEIVITLNGFKEYWMGFKQEGLGVRLQPVSEKLTTGETRSKNLLQMSKMHRCLDGKVYIIREMGMMSKDNILTGYGLKSINELLKGYTIEEGVFQLPHTITRYQSTTLRPKKCTQTFGNHLKRSFHYRDSFMDMQILEHISKKKTLIQQDIVGLKKQVLAHSLIQRPNKRKQVEEPPQIQIQEVQQSKQDKTFKRGSFLDGNNKELSSRLQEVKKEIYNSIQLKKSNKNLLNIDYTNIKKKEADLQTNMKTPNRPTNSPVKEVNRSNMTSESTHQKHYLKNQSLTKDKSKSREFIETRKNGSITPRKKYQYIKEQKQDSTLTPSKSPPVATRTTPGYILKTDKSKSAIKTPIMQRVSYREPVQKKVPQSKNYLQHKDHQERQGLQTAKLVERRGIGQGQKKNVQNVSLREKQSRSYLSRNKKKRLLNELDNFQL